MICYYVYSVFCKNQKRKIKIKRDNKKQKKKIQKNPKKQRKRNKPPPIFLLQYNIPL
jgi:hypothetical protein